MTRPLAIDLFCGLGGWTEGLLAEGCAPSGKNGGGQMLRVAVSLPPDDFRRLAGLAKKRGQPVAGVVRTAVSRYLAGEDD